MSRTHHDQDLAQAFDGQAPKFERAPIQSNPVALRQLVEEARFPESSRILDAGCGPGLVAQSLLDHGFSVLGVDLSPEMIERARARCPEGGTRAEFRVGSVYDSDLETLGPFDGSISRFVLHHIEDPLRFLRRQTALIRPGGVVVLCDHVADPDSDRRAWHQEIELLRDRTHTANLSLGTIVDLFTASGLEQVSCVTHEFTLDFDEWFDRGTPTVSKAECRRRLLAGSAHSFEPSLQPNGHIAIRAWHAIVRGVKPDNPMPH